MATDGSASQRELEVPLVDSKRWRILTKTCSIGLEKGPIVYWMSRDQRVQGILITNLEMVKCGWLY